MLMASLESTVRVTSMVMIIVLFAFIFNFVINVIGLVDIIIDGVTELQLTKYQTFLAVVVMFIILGCFMETMTMLIAIVPTTTQVMMGVGFDGVWFGIVIVLLMEMALITPPVGMNIFVIQGLRKDLRFPEVARGCTPFIIAVMTMIALLALFPGIALYIPDTVFN